MKQFFDTDWWKNTTGCTVGTIIGILLTFGTSFHLENRNKAEMARKTVLLTLHNLDASTRNMQTLLDELQQYDTLFTRAASLMPDRLGEMGDDSLRIFMRNDVRYVLQIHPNITQMLRNTHDIVCQLNERNKQVLRITQEELDEAGKLLEKNSYDIDSDDIQSPENNLNENEGNE